jgi:hypothetical protein
MPDFSAYCKQDNVPSYNDLDGRYPIKLPTQIREEPYVVNCKSVVEIRDDGGRMVGVSCPRAYFFVTTILIKRKHREKLRREVAPKLL